MMIASKLKGLRKFTLCMTGMGLSFLALVLGKIDAETFKFITVGSMTSFAGADVFDHFRAGLQKKGETVEQPERGPEGGDS